MDESPLFLTPDWHLPPGVMAFVTTRQGGCSAGPWSSFNLGLNVGDVATQVAANRARLLHALEARTGRQDLSIQWLQQVHGCTVYEALRPCNNAPPPQADALHTDQSGIVCAVLTADCLPVLFCAADGSEIAVAHAGWRGLLGGILERTVQSFRAPPAGIHAWLGPAIGPCHFEVGPEVREAFVNASGQHREATQTAFRLQPEDRDEGVRYLADLYHLARLRLTGLASVTGEPVCTLCDSELWYSYRGAPVTGRFASGILRS